MSLKRILPRGKLLTVVTNSKRRFGLVGFISQYSFVVTRGYSNIVNIMSDYDRNILNLYNRLVGDSTAVENGFI